MDAGALVVVAVVGAIVFIQFRRHHDAVDRSRVLRRVGFGVMAFFSVFLGLFIVGETLADPGGWKGAGLVALWLVPVAALATLAWMRPGLVVWLLAALVAAAISLSVWFAVQPQAWRSFEDAHGPVRTIVTFALATVLGLYGLKRTRAAGVMLLVLGVVPILLATRGPGAASLALASSAPVITGLLYLWSAALGRGEPSPAAGVTPSDQPLAA